jgi:hypothetical protein
MARQKDRHVKPDVSMLEPAIPCIKIEILEKVK